MGVRRASVGRSSDPFGPDSEKKSKRITGGGGFKRVGNLTLLLKSIDRVWNWLGGFGGEKTRSPGVGL